MNKLSIVYTKRSLCTHDNKRTRETEDMVAKAEADARQRSETAVESFIVTNTLADCYWI
jgi:hypothetical protein